jgi:hypothetical protein
MQQESKLGGKLTRASASIKRTAKGRMQQESLFGGRLAWARTLAKGEKAKIKEHKQEKDSKIPQA